MSSLAAASCSPSTLRSERMVALTYPRSWAVAPNVRSRQYEKICHEWMVARGIVANPTDEEKFQRLSVGLYANWPFPNPSPERAIIITKFLALWIFYDDIIEESDDGQRDAIFDAIAGRESGSHVDSLHVSCWRELGRSYAKVMSEAWLARHATRFAEWVESVRQEHDRAHWLRASGGLPTLREQLSLRQIGVGMIPNIDFIEYQMGWELPQEILDDPSMKVLEEASADCVAISNDMCGFKKDGALAWSNCVACAMHEFRLSVGEALDTLANIHNIRVNAMVHHEQILLKRFGNRHPRLREWIDGLHHVVYGFAQWQLRAPRYDSCFAYGDENVRIIVEEK